MLCPRGAAGREYEIGIDGHAVERCQEKRLVTFFNFKPRNKTAAGSNPAAEVNQPFSARLLYVERPAWHDRAAVGLDGP
jgi:hypothetical protein